VTRRPEGGMFFASRVDRDLQPESHHIQFAEQFHLEGDCAPGMETTFASLMVRAQDDRCALRPRRARRSDIGRRPDLQFLLRPGTKFHDGSPLTAHDVGVLSEVAERERPSHHPAAASGFRCCGGLRPGDGFVRFAPDKARDTPLFLAAMRSSLRLLCRASVRGDDARAAARSGPYKVGQFEAGRFVEFERVKDGGRRCAGLARAKQLRRGPL